MSSDVFQPISQHVKYERLQKEVSPLKLYGRITSFNVQKILWFLEELQIPYEHVEVGGRFGGLDTEQFKMLNPMQKVPVLIDNNQAIWESHTILRYLAASYGGLDWYVDNAYTRSLYERWQDWSQVTFQPAFMGVFWNYYRMPPSKRNMEAVNRELDKCQQCIGLIEQALAKSEFLAGTSITLADICVGGVFYRLTTQGLEIELPAHVSTWFEALKTRPGYKKWIMSDFTDLQGREDF
ncbi:glutathione S-transferase family protein [Celerinatantimonas yamalensis]|uniref:Glutathione S-transferase family protein n=1 Tax=Celerinatantimonas yamalensis TaxID=559956 RepID=A0ABW9G4K0_9GAMM